MDDNEEKLAEEETKPPLSTLLARWVEALAIPNSLFELPLC